MNFTTHTFTAAPLSSAASFSSLRRSRASITTLVLAEEEPSRTNTTSESSFSSALGRESFTSEVQVVVSRGVTVLDLETPVV